MISFFSTSDLFRLANISAHSLLFAFKNIYACLICIFMLISQISHNPYMYVTMIIQWIITFTLNMASEFYSKSLVHCFILTCYSTSPLEKGLYLGQVQILLSPVSYILVWPFRLF